MGSIRRSQKLADLGRNPFTGAPVPVRPPCNHSVQPHGGGHPEVQTCTKCGELLLRGKAAGERDK